MHGDAWNLGQQPALQGLRAVAVVSVIVFHLGRAPGGWLGVELFFVLSGFLITILLLKEASKNVVRIGAFYARRAGRLAPALIATVTLSALMAYAADTFPEQVGWGALLSVLYVANWGAASGYDYAALQHTWSLNIEEQFYFIWPLVLIALVRRWGPRSVLVAATLGFIASTLLRSFFITGSPEQWFDRVYYATDTRAAALMIGAAAGAALYESQGTLTKRIPGSVVAGIAATVGILMLALPLQVNVTWQVAVPIFDLTVAILLVGVVNRSGPLLSALGWRPLTYIGDISYGLYLWQGPVIFFSSILVEPTAPRMAVQIVLPFLVASISYHALEQPIRRAVNTRVSDRATTQ